LEPLDKKLREALKKWKTDFREFYRKSSHTVGLFGFCLHLPCQRKGEPEFTLPTPGRKTILQS
jgi:hypothetical protein